MKNNKITKIKVNKLLTFKEVDEDQYVEGYEINDGSENVFNNHLNVIFV